MNLSYFYLFLRNLTIIYIMHHSTPSNNHHFTQTQLHFTHQKQHLTSSAISHVVNKPRPIVIEKLVTVPLQGISVFDENTISGTQQHLSI